MVGRRQFFKVGVAATLGFAASRSLLAQEGGTCAFFALNTQDFAYPTLSASTVARVVALHESLNVPIDVSLTTTMVDLFESQAPDLLRTLCSSPVVCLAYHTRPPTPYHTNYDWLSVSRLSSGDQRTLIRQYETHGLDLRTGQPTTASGGYAKLASLAGYAPPSVGILVEGTTLQASADSAFRDLGATFGVVHGRTANLGERRNALWVRPEHVDVKLFEHVGEDAREVVADAVTDAPGTANARAPYVVGIKMRDNDFFAEKSAWTTVYLAPGARRGPPWDTELRSPLLPSEEQAAMWSLYESAVRYVSSIGAALPVFNSKHWLAAPGASAQPSRWSTR